MSRGVLVCLNLFLFFRAIPAFRLLDTARIVVYKKSVQKCIIPLALSGALLGPNLDNYHSVFGVLEYKYPVQVVVEDSLLLTTASWVPPLFAVAGVGIGTLYLYFDQLLSTNEQKRKPSWPAAFLCISLFTFQYYLSGVLFHEGYDAATLSFVLLPFAFGGFWAFDRTKSGAIVSLMTAVLGPLIELALVNFTDQYTYANADFFGIDSWIPVVYFLGGPAVGNLARAFSNTFEQLEPEAKET